MFRYTRNKFRIFLSQSYITRVFSSQITDSKKALRKGVALLLVLGTLMVVLVLAGIILGIVSSQSRLTHHQVSRIQAYYAALAGMNLALENLRPPAIWGPGTYRLCESGCSAPNVSDGEIPYNITISISAANVSTGIYTIDIFCNYTYVTP
jgi:hypothetical protein